MNGYKSISYIAGQLLRNMSYKYKIILLFRTRLLNNLNQVVNYYAV
ncbi:MAG: hypothetical protein LBB88_12310 [Planctomycetaceae bacterium]|nr:hypothetical protein [Planctomycetaceae bacterium]